MEYVLEERIGDPDLFTGRKEELDFFLGWIEGIKKRKSQSTAMLARRKMGKTALMERLFNITFNKNAGVIPFYYEVRETKMWVADFCLDFFLTFIYQYIAFKSRKAEYLLFSNKTDLVEASAVAENEGLGYLCDLIKSVAHAAENDRVDALWNVVRDAPKIVAAGQKEFIVQMIDEFQFLNSMIYWDKKKSEDQLASTLAGAYLNTAESKIAPLLVSGSWVGWLMNLLTMMLPARFRYEYLQNMPKDEAVEMIYKYSWFFEVPVVEETVYMLAEIAEGSPFYIASVMRSACPKKDLTTIDGLIAALEFETLDNRGIIKYTWMEYVRSALPRINEKNAKNIVLYLSKNNHRELTRKEILDDLNLDMTDGELEEKLKALVRADIIMQGHSNFRYRGVSDNIFGKVFRGVYEEEIREFDVKVIRKEYRRDLEGLNKKYNQLLGKYNRQKGYFAEYAILDQLQFHALEKNEALKAVTRYLPVDFNFCTYDHVWKYDGSRVHSRSFNIDVLARAQAPGDYSIIGEVKNRETTKFSKAEAEEFETKLAAVKAFEKIERVIGFIFSRSGFTAEAEAYCREKGIACSEHDLWLGD